MSNADIIIIGVLVSLVYFELTGFSPSGLVVPGYIALCLSTPQRVVYTLAVVFLTFGLAKALSCVIIMYGRRRFALVIVLSYVIHHIILAFGFFTYNPGIVGVLVPGIMAQEFEKQGVVNSLVSLGIVLSVIVLIMFWNGIPVFSL